MARIYLIGFMGVGKSTIGKKLAEMLGYSFLDLDDAFEEKYKTNIKSFFHKYDETLFRTLERTLLKSTFAMDNTVISTGGGTPCFFDSMEKMNAHGITIYLSMPAGELVSRLQTAKRPRPLIVSRQKDSLDGFVAYKLAERKPFYEKAQLHVDATNIDYKVLYTKIKNKIENVV